MAEPNTTLASGAALTTLATLTVGPILGEYFVIIILGLLGTLIALSEEHKETLRESLFFIFKGVLFSFVFTGIITTLVLKYLSTDSGLTPYTLLGAVSFSIGWTSNKWDKVKDWLVALLTSSKKPD